MVNRSYEETELPLDELPDKYNVIAAKDNEQVEVHTVWEELIYSPEGAKQLGKALIERAEELEDNDG
jgi:hypothetical protein